MAKHTFIGGDGASGETGLQVITYLNSMFTELYNALHTRAHSIISSSDHPAVTGTDKGKLLGTNETTGAVELRFLTEGEIPVEIARDADLQAHIDDTDNPHQVTAQQLGLESGTTFTAGAGLELTDGVLDVVAKTNGGLVSTQNTHDVALDFDNLTTSGTPELTDVYIAGKADKSIVKYTMTQLLTTFSAGKAAGVSRYGVDDDGEGLSIEALASGTGITATLASGNRLTIDIPDGVKLISLKLRWTGTATLELFMGFTDMTNTNAGNRWMPIVQGWREDTGAQNTGITVTLNTDQHDHFTINGLITSTNNHLRLSF